MKIIITVAIILAAMVFLFLAIDARPQESESSQPEAAEDVIDIVMISDTPRARILLEAEDVDEIELPVSIATGIEGASHGKCCYLGPEKVNEKKETAQYKKGYPEALYPGYASVSFKVPETAEYTAWVRVRWSDECGDSLDIALDGKFLGTVQGNSDKKNPRWIWLQLGTARIPLTARLEAGSTHTLTLANREDDLYFDQVLLLDKNQPVEPVGVEKY